MKKIVLIVVIGLILGGCVSTSEVRNIKFYRGSYKIIIPEPSREYLTSQQDYFIMAGDNLISFDNTFFLFKKKVDFNKYNRDYPDTIIQRIFHYNDCFLKKHSCNCSEYDFLNFKNSELESFLINLDTVKINADSYFNHNSNKIEDKVNIKHVKLGYFFNTLNTFCTLTLFIHELDKKRNNRLVCTIYEKIKNSVIGIDVVFNYYDDESIIKIKNFSEAWAKAILEANK